MLMCECTDTDTEKDAPACTHCTHSLLGTAAAEICIIAVGHICQAAVTCREREKEREEMRKTAEGNERMSKKAERERERMTGEN